MSRNVFIKNVLHDNVASDVVIRDGKFSKIAPADVNAVPEKGFEVIDGTGKAILPPFYNGHTHAAMTLMRGLADDMELFKWLNEYIWPVESHLTQEHVYNGTRLALLEMIKSGTVFINDMYWCQKATLRAVEEMGVRACIGIMNLTLGDGKDERLDNDYLEERKKSMPENVLLSYAPHAIYTVCADELRKSAENAKASGVMFHMHLAETKKEFDDCMKEHSMTPVAYVNSLGLLTDKAVFAHSVYMTDEDFALIAEKGCLLVNNPVSNLKLSSGVFRYSAALKYGCNVAIGTDGACSNNSLSMLEEMKFASLLAKVENMDPSAFGSKAVYAAATRNCAKAFGINAGVIAEGYEGDCILVDLSSPSMVPCHDVISNMVYASEASCIDTVICAGRILMRDRKVDGEDEIKALAAESAKSLATFAKR